MGNESKCRERITISSLTLSKKSESKLNREKHLVFNAEVNNSQSISTLLDNGSEGELFDHSLAHQLELPIFRLKRKIPLYLTDDKKLQDIAEATLVDLRIGLPPHRPVDHEILLEEGKTPSFTRSYKPMSTQELDAVKKYIDEHLGKGFIRSSSSPACYW